MDKSDSKIYINEFGTKVYRNSKGGFHRLDGPAIEWESGNNFWYKNGKRHRENGPAREWDGNKEWYKEGLCHRVDGPAAEYSNGDKSWFILDKKLEEKEFNSWISRIQKCI